MKAWRGVILLLAVLVLGALGAQQAVPYYTYASTLMSPTPTRPRLALTHTASRTPTPQPPAPTQTPIPETAAPTPTPAPPADTPAARVSVGSVAGASATVAPVPRRTPGSVAILMYHYVRVNPNPADTVGAGLSVSPQNFEAQMQFLAQRGYRTISLADLENLAARAGKAVVITLDDGYADAYTNALPVLQRYGFRGTFYVIAGKVGTANYLNWDQVLALQAAGMTIGSHTVTHPDLTKLAPKDQSYQLAESRRVLEARLNVPVTDFCYPSGRLDDGVRQAAQAAGYRTATTTRGGFSVLGMDPLALPRVRVSGGMSLAAFASAIGETPGN